MWKMTLLVHFEKIYDTNYNLESHYDFGSLVDLKQLPALYSVIPDPLWVGREANLPINVIPRSYSKWEIHYNNSSTK